MTWAALVTGLCVGLVVGALGAGGGILSVPVLVHLLSQPPHRATAESLVIVVVTALVALPSRARRGQVRWGRGVIFGLLSTAGAVAGTALNRLARQDVLMVSFAALLVAVGVHMAREARRQAAAEARDGESRARPFDRADPRDRGTGGWPGVVLAATLTGLLTGFFGVGGGFVVVPVLTLFLGMEIRAASGTSLLVMSIAGLVSLASRQLSGGLDVDWGLTVMFTAGSAAGGLLGGPLSQQVRASTLTGVFAALLLVVAASTLIATVLT